MSFYNDNIKKISRLKTDKKWTDLRTLAEKGWQTTGDYDCLEILAEDFYYGRSIETNYAKAFQMFKEIVEKIPKPYSVNDLAIIFNGIDFNSSGNQQCKMKLTSDGFGSPIGSYILYSRTNYGSEKHSYVQFSTDDDNIESMRSIFFELTKTIGGKYEGTEYHSQENHPRNTSEL